ncbi:spinster family MFS transporter [Niveispirillum sp. KHB5.9]|uniref:spinster family MFS transporter n=1 Tax=Niveispirillum sp. KHB5.9 TaxID=3400269 RepID=UPI003A8A7EB0
MQSDGSSMSAPVPRYSWYVLGMLYAVYVMNMADRQILGILAEDVKRELDLTDGQLGLLAGPAIAFFYAVLGIPMAYIADRVNRVRFLTICLTVWSVMTALGGRAGNLLELAMTRVGVSVAEAGSTPASISLISDYFPPTRRATAMAVLSSGSTLGILVSFALGGLLNEWLGWRHTFLVAGVPGVVLAAILVLSLREPQRGQRDPVAATPPPSLSMFRTMAHLWRMPLFRQAVIAAVFCNFCVFAVLSWVPAYAVRSFGLGSAEVGRTIGLGIAGLGGASMILSGLATDHFARRGLWVPLWAIAGVLALSALCFVLALMAADFTGFVSFLILAYALLITNSPLILAVLQSKSPPNMRAMATAVMLLLIALFASVPAPMLVGYGSDLLAPHVGADSLRLALFLVPLAALGGSVQLVRVGFTARREQRITADPLG